MTYREIIEKQRSLLPPSCSWWPKYFYHFTNIENAFGIMEKGWIYGRNDAEYNNLMRTDNASPSVISVSQNKIKEYARLYFRPRTPTQYNNEGYKPEHIRSETNANCPVPVFFFLDSIAVLNTEGVQFSEVSCSGYRDINLMSGEKAFEQLPFEKIYHNRYFTLDERDDIITHRHAEVVRLGGLSIRDSLKGIVCRSSAEKQTMLYVLRTKYPQLYAIYRNMIRYSPELDLFFNNGVFIKDVKFDEKSVRIELNECSKRYGAEKSNGKDISFRAEIHYLDDNENIIDRAVFSAPMDYGKHSLAGLDISKRKSDVAIVEVYFDNILMYANKLNFNMEYLL